MNAYVISENAPLVNELAAAAAELVGGADRITAIVPAAIADDVKGVGSVLSIAVPDNQPTDALAATAAGAIKADEPTLVMVGATGIGRSIAARVAHALGTAAIADAKRLMVEEGRIMVQHALYGGSALLTDAATGPASVVLVPAGSHEPADAPAGPTTPLDWTEPARKVVLKATRAKESAKKDVASAKTIVCAGGGVKTPEELGLLEELAEKLEGVTSCSRPLTEGENSLFYGEDYIGMTGISVKPTLYIGVGVSGQVQHTQGFEEAKVTVGINTDQKANIFRFSDYGIVGDLNDVVPALIKALD